MIRANLSIFNFKGAKLLGEFLCVIILFSTTIKVMNYLLVNDTESYTRITIHEMYTQEENIDTLFLGSSHCYRSFDTSITDKYLGNTFNAGSSSQALDGSYALLVEAGKENDIKRVFLEFYYDTVTEEYSDRTELTSTYIISDYLKPSMNKYSYILSASSREYWINGLFPARRNWKNIFDGEIITENIVNKRGDAYRNYDYVDYGWEYYAGKGYVANTGIVNVDDYIDMEYDKIKQQHISEDNLLMLSKIADYCEDNNIELVLVVAPMPLFRLNKVGNYDEYISQASSIARELGVKFYDFNLCKDSFDNRCFMDDHHLNKVGAEKFSILFSKLFAGEMAEEGLFYSSMYEKLQRG